jgi:hypothetical protein
VVTVSSTDTSLWARAKLLDLVEESLAGKRSPWSKALKFSTLAVLFSIGGDVYEAVIRATTEKLRVRTIHLLY